MRCRTYPKCHNNVRSPNETLPVEIVRVRGYDLSRSGQYFIVLTDVEPAGAAKAPEPIFIVQNWTEQLKRRVPGAQK